MKDNDYLSKLEENQLRDLVEVMHKVDVKKGDKVITEGEANSMMYIVEG